MSKFVLLASFAIAFNISPVSARPSLEETDTIDELVVEIDGVQEAFSVIRDAQRRKQWYYAPSQPRLYETVVNGVRRPEFVLVRYQAPDPNNPEGFVQAGIIQFAVRLSLPGEALNQLKAALTTKLEAKPGEISLSALRMKNATVNVYDDGGTLIGQKFKPSGVAPTFATQKMAFHVPLTELGADVFDALVNGNTGILVSVAFSYDGVSPAVGATCKVNWDSVYKLYTKDQKFAASASYMGAFKASANVEKTKIRERLESEKAVVCSGISDAKFDASAMMDKMLAKINSNVVDKITPPAKLDAPEAKKPKGGGLGKKLGGIKKAFGFGASASYSVKIKDVKQVRKGEETYQMNSRTVETRNTVAAGFIGIGRYSEDLRDEMVIDVAAGNWEKAIFLLPPVGTESGLQRVDFQVQLNTEPPQSQTAIWEPEKGWKDGKGRPRHSLAFGLLGVNDGDLTALQFTEKIQMTRGGDVLRMESQRDVVNGDIPVATPLERVDVVTIDGAYLSWKKLDPASPLVAVHIKLTGGNRLFRGTLKAQRIDRDWSEPDPLIWYVPKGVPISPTIEFQRSDSALKVKWRGNGSHLEDSTASLNLMLADHDWK